MKRKNKVVLMAIASGNDTPESVSIKRYTGIAACTLLAINPNKEELGKIFETNAGPATFEKEPEYTGQGQDETKYIRLDLFLQTIPEKSNGISTIIKVGYFIRNSNRLNRDGTKLQVINAYGDTTWLTQAQFESKTPPESMPNYQMTGVRPAFAGEEDFTKFLKRFLNIPAYSYRKADGTIVTAEDPKQAECQLSKIPNYFNGDISEVKGALLARKSNKIKFLFGVKTTLDNKSYQDCFIQMPISYLTNDYKRVIDAMMNQKQAGGYTNTDFGKSPFIFQEWTLVPTSVENMTTVNPFGNVPQTSQSNNSSNQGASIVGGPIPWGTNLPGTDSEDLPE